MKKSFIALTSLAALFTVSLGACNGGNKQALPFDGITDITPNRHALALFTGETFDLDIKVLPKSAEAPELFYHTSNSKVATIKDGTVTAIGPGICDVYVENSDRSVSKTIRVYVNNNSLSKNAAKKLGKSIANAQIEHKSADIICVSEIYDQSLTKNEVVQKTNWFDQYMVVSKENAYLYLTSNDFETHVQGGSVEESSSSWYMYTTASYDTYVFHIDGKLKRYMVVDTTSFIGKDRYLALYDVLENIFVSGKAIVSNQYNDFAGNSPLTSYVGSGERFGSLNEANLMFDLHASYDDEEVAADEEEDYEVPAGTKYTLTIDNTFCFNNYYCAVKDIKQGMIYKLGDDDYVDMVKVSYHYQEGSAKDLIYPNTSDFERVDSVYDV